MAETQLTGEESDAPVAAADEFVTFPQSLGSCSDTHTWLMMWASHRIMVSPPAFNISPVMVQIPGALLLLSFFSGVLTLAGVTGSSPQLLLVANMPAAIVRLGSVETGGW